MLTCISNSGILFYASVSLFLSNPHFSPAQATLFPFLFFFGTSVIVRPAAARPISTEILHAYIPIQSLLLSQYAFNLPTYREVDSVSAYLPFRSPLIPVYTGSVNTGLWIWFDVGCALCGQLRSQDQLLRFNRRMWGVWYISHLSVGRSQWIAWYLIPREALWASLGREGKSQDCG